ncbi:MAG: hypothetical protein ABF633_03345 [Clostridium sp.]|uniref:hypothetical protein n=1 Tax=Clostridium sp. TaxID=1506 RepID=UPI0039ECCF99
MKKLILVIAVLLVVTVYAQNNHHEIIEGVNITLTTKDLKAMSSDDIDTYREVVYNLEQRQLKSLKDEKLKQSLELQYEVLEDNLIVLANNKDGLEHYTENEINYVYQNIEAVKNTIQILGGRK